MGHKNNVKDFPNIFRMDDLLVFDGALTEEDIQNLKAYYGE